MKSIAFFNNKGGVGKTSLLYHLAHAYADMGVSVVVADLDPQANLTSLCLDDDRLEKLWSAPILQRQTVFGAVHPIKEELGDFRSVAAEPIASRLALLPGDIELSTFEGKLANAWGRCLDRHNPSFRATSAFSRVVAAVANEANATLALIDVGPNLGAINRAALIAADWVVTPLNADLFSIQGLRNLGPTLTSWRDEWTERATKNPGELRLPTGSMRGAGYVIVQPSLYDGKVALAYQRWIRKMPAEYARAMMPTAVSTATEVSSDPNCLGVVKNYRSLMALAHDARKPIFHLKGADGALGANAVAAGEAGGHFRALARSLANSISLDLNPVHTSNFGGGP